MSNTQTAEFFSVDEKINNRTKLNGSYFAHGECPDQMLSKSGYIHLGPPWDRFPSLHLRCFENHLCLTKLTVPNI